ARGRRRHAVRRLRRLRRPPGAGRRLAQVRRRRARGAGQEARAARRVRGRSRQERARLGGLRGGGRGRRQGHGCHRAVLDGDGREEIGRRRAEEARRQGAQGPIADL
ncbi:hypothetical protein KEM52_004629, partial [Ascosphaera acerosa]